MDPDLLASFARRDYVTDDSPEAEAHAEALAVEQWMMAGRPAVDGLSSEDRALLEAAPLTVKQAALRETASERQVYRWLKSGELEAHRVGRGWRITPDALDRRRVESARPKVKPEPPKRRRRRGSASKPTAPAMDWWTA